MDKNSNIQLTNGGYIPLGAEKGVEMNVKVTRIVKYY
jgi:hypothetical protein